MQELEDSKRVFGMVVLFGFETKNFLDSGLYNMLSSNFKTIVLKRSFPTTNFQEHIRKYSLNVIELNPMLKKKRLRSESLFLASRRARNRISNIVNFNYFKSDREMKVSDYLLGNSILNSKLKTYAFKKILHYYNDSKIREIYKNEGITDIVIAGYSSVESITLAITAQKSNINVWLVINSWKDFYVNDLIPFTPTKVFVWSRQMKEQLLNTNNHIDADNIVVSGNPSFDRFFEYIPSHDKGYYAAKYNFDMKRPLILYSMISPKAYAHEKEIIEQINLELIRLYPVESERPIILLRKNPIDETLSDDNYFTGNNVRYADNYFEGNYKNAVFVQLAEGETEWLDLLYHADININIASTVTLESLMMKTSVINIEFNHTGVKDTQLSRYAEAPFYKPLHGRDDVVIASTIEQCMQTIQRFIADKIIPTDVRPILDKFDGKATERIFEAIENE